MSCISIKYNMKRDVPADHQTRVRKANKTLYNKIIAEYHIIGEAE